MPELLGTIKAVFADDTHTHNRFMAFLDFVRDYLDEPVPERYNHEGKTNLDLLE